jgi:hypothetical protein
MIQSESDPPLRAFRLAPRDPNNAVWEASTARTVLWVLAENENEARELAKQATFFASRLEPGVFNRGSPWIFAELATCEPVEAPFPLEPRVVVGPDGRALNP